MNTLEKQYDSLLTAPIPKPTKVPKTFFDIGGFGHRENIVSNFYAYYLDQNELHGLKYLFLETLLDLINEHTYFPYDWSEWEIRREVIVEIETYQNGKIDLWIEELEEEKKVIIIENKIFHQVNNDLEGYLRKVDVPFSDNKIGVLLTVKPVKKKIKGFVNITHNQWIKAVQKAFRASKIALNQRQEFLFKDFCRNFDTHIKQSKSMMERHTFFLKNRKKIKELQELEKEYKRDFLNAIENVAIEYGYNIEYKTYANSPYIDLEMSERPRIWLSFKINDNPRENPITATIYFNNTHYAPRAKPILKRSALFKKYEHRKIKKAVQEYSSMYDLPIAFKNYTLTDLKVESLEAFVIKCFENDWIPFRDELEKYYWRVNKK